VYEIGSRDALAKLGLIKYASRLRQLFQLETVPGVTGTTTYKGLLGGRDVGMLAVAPEGHVSWSNIQPECQGMGLGKKMYGEVMRRRPGQTLMSDQTVSPEAVRVWESMAKRPAYNVTRGPARVDPGGGMRPAQYLQEQPIFQGKLPPQAAIQSN
jgi:hypothetical protein